MHLLLLRTNTNVRIASPVTRKYAVFGRVRENRTGGRVNKCGTYRAVTTDCKRVLREDGLAPGLTGNGAADRGGLLGFSSFSARADLSMTASNSSSRVIFDCGDKFDVLETLLPQPLPPLPLPALLQLLLSPPLCCRSRRCCDCPIFASFWKSPACSARLPG
jgi:hypothetical protein